MFYRKIKFDLNFVRKSIIREAGHNTTYFIITIGLQTTHMFVKKFKKII